MIVTSASTLPFSLFLPFLNEQMDWAGGSKNGTSFVVILFPLVIKWTDGLLNPP